MKYSIRMIDAQGNGCYLSVKGRTEWKTKRCALCHKQDVEANKMQLFGVVAVAVVNEFGEIQG